MFEFLNIENSTTIQVLLTMVGTLTVLYVCFRIISWLVKQIAIMIKWTIRVVIVTALSQFLLQWAGAKFSLSETVRTLLL
jgi:hypothetical protein